MKEETIEQISMITLLLIKDKTPKILRVIENKSLIKISVITDNLIERVELVECKILII
jgi:hypothetical protein